MDPQKQIANYWDSFVNAYSSIAQNLSIFGITLINVLKLQEAQQILEVGCGTGFTTGLILTQFKNPQAQLTSMDISPEMVQYTKRVLFQKLAKKQDYNEEEATKFFNDFKFSISQGDVEDLSKFQNETFDVYHSNLVFHITSDSQKALKESFRVLKKGGRLGFSVWGRKAQSPFFTLLKSLLMDCEYEMPQMGHDLFKLGEDKGELRKNLEQIGFKNILIWNQSSAMDRLTPEEYINSQNPKLKALLESDQQKYFMFKEKLQQRFDYQLNEVGEPFMIDILLVKAEK